MIISITFIMINDKSNDSEKGCSDERGSLTWSVLSQEDASRNGADT